jgi:hypothetical protein
MLVLLACAPESPVVGEAVTDDGSWRLTLGTTAYDRGAARLEVSAEALTDEVAAEALSVRVRPDMEAMAHTLDLVDFDEPEPGFYAADVVFDMSGVWTLPGYAGDDARTEAFSFTVEVRP